MDEQVMRALARWPNVPDVFGWLALDIHGHWRIREERIAHTHLREFIGRNYAADRRGRWYFQNGPQRVFVSLDYTPWVYHVGPDGLRTHTDRPATVRRVWMDDEANLLFTSEFGIGVLARRDLPQLEPHLTVGSGELDDQALVSATRLAREQRDTGLLLDLAGHKHRIRGIARSAIAQRFGFDAEPDDN